MIQFFIGTGAEIIKVMPVMMEMKRRGLPYRYIDSGQHVRTRRWLCQDFDLGEPHYVLSQREKNIATLSSGLAWMGKQLGKGFFARSWLRDEVFAGGGVCLIYGDTATTYLGLELGRMAGLKVGLLEAGLRSFNRFSPFPEEIIRVRCDKKCEYLFPFNPQAAQNLRDMKVGGRIIAIDGNPVVDGLRMALAKTPTVEIPSEPFGLAAIHRMETITNAGRFRRVLAFIRRASEIRPIVFIKYPATVSYLERFKLLGELDHPRVRAVPMLPHYYDFIAMVRAANFVIADGCGVQEECALLNKPYLILRNETERPDGLGRSAMLWRFDDRVVDEFFGKIDQLGAHDKPVWTHPSAQIVDSLAELGDAR